MEEEYGSNGAGKGVTCLIMAGGRGTRLGISIEKPLLEIGSKTILERVVEAALSASKVDRVVVTVTSFTPETKKRLEEKSVPYIVTQGEGFIEDMRFAIKEADLFGGVLVLVCDIPLITGKDIDEIVAQYERCGKPAMSVMVKAEVYERVGLDPSYIVELEDGELAVPTGINFVQAELIKSLGVEDVLEEEVYVSDNVNFAANINKMKDFEAVEKLLKKQ
ncbi:MAG: NTP transferase domain-containing protein [Candidatus Wukongarchaeota archaeon]|nr:NTP transferase domain-containing protein [Candidatus Wukongarchaeota archaeon]